MCGAWGMGREALCGGTPRRLGGCVQAGRGAERRAESNRAPSAAPPPRRRAVGRRARAGRGGAVPGAAGGGAGARVRGGRRAGVPQPHAGGWVGGWVRVRGGVWPVVVWWVLGTRLRGVCGARPGLARVPLPASPPPPPQTSTTVTNTACEHRAADPPPLQLLAYCYSCGLLAADCLFSFLGVLAQRWAAFRGLFSGFPHFPLPHFSPVPPPPKKTTSFLPKAQPFLSPKQ